MFSLLSLVPPSCMVVPIRDFGNKFFLSSPNTHSQQTFDLPTVASSINIGIDIPLRNLSDNYDKVRGRTSLPKLQSLVAYYERMEYNNGLNEDINMGDDSPQLSYVMSKEQANHISMVADPNNNTINKCVLIEHSISSPPHVNDTVINI